MKVCDLENPKPGFPKRGRVFSSENATMTIFDSWDGKAINVDLTVFDRSSNFVGEDEGDPRDAPLFSGWKVKEAKNIPETAERIGNDPQENSWVEIPQNGLIFDYKGLPNSPPAYNDVIVRETFSMPKAGNIFSIDDIHESYLDDLSATITADEIAAMLFEANPNTFAFNSANEFMDTHDGFGVQEMIDLNLVFKDSAFQNKRVGYLLKQDFNCCGKIIMENNEVSRRLEPSQLPFSLDDSFIIELKKKH